MNRCIPILCLALLVGCTGRQRPGHYDKPSGAKWSRSAGSGNTAAPVNVDGKAIRLEVFAGGRSFGVETSPSVNGPWTVLWERPNEYVIRSIVFEAYPIEPQKYYRSFAR